MNCSMRASRVPEAMRPLDMVMTAADYGRLNRCGGSIRCKSDVGDTIIKADATETAARIEGKRVERE